ncbi:hypothetical protein Tco_0341695, partial [Tanacetum coccineum]
KPEGSIAEGYVAKEALTFSSHYFWDVTMKFNRPDRNVNCPPPTCQFQVFRSICKSIGKRSVIRFDQQELKKVIWYVLHNSPGIHMYWAKFKSEFPNQDMKEEFPGWFGSQIRQRYIDKDPGVSVCVELFALACGPTLSPISVNSCVVNGVRFVVHSRDERRTTQNNGICSPGEMDGEIYYGQLKEILEFLYMSFKVVLFRVKWFDTSNEGCKIKRFVIRNNIIQIWAHSESFKDDQYILATQVKQVFYLEDMARRPLDRTIVQDVNHKKFLNGVSTWRIPHDLADCDDEVFANDDDVAVMSADVARGHGGDDRPLSRQIFTDCQGMGGQKPNMGGKRAGRLGTREETRNLGLRKITDEWGPQKIRFEFNDRGTLLPLDDHAALWSNLIGEIVREFPMHYPSWHKIKPEKKAGVMGTLRTRDVEGIISRPPPNIKQLDWNKQIDYWVDAKNAARALQNAQNQAKSKVFCRQGSRSRVVIRDMQDDARIQYEEMLTLKDLGANMPTGVPDTEDQIMAMVCRGKQRGHIPGVGRVLAGQGRDVISINEPRCTHNDAYVDEVKVENKRLRKELNMLRTVVSSDDQMSQLLMQLESQLEIGGGSGSGGGEDDEPGTDEDAGGDKDADGSLGS